MNSTKVANCGTHNIVNENSYYGLIEQTMDFTPELSAFQGTLISADNVHSFSRLISKGGNEDKIEYIINNLKKFLKDRECLEDHHIPDDKLPTIRKFALFLVLNADLPALEQMVDKEGVEFVIWILPTIPKFLLSEMLWKLHMGRFVWETIVFCFPPLAVEVASALIENLKYLSPNECRSKLNLIAVACYNLICRLHFFNFENDIISNMLSTTFINFNQCLNYFVTPPNASKLTSLSKDDIYKFKGSNLRTMLNLISDCMELFTSKHTFASNNFDDIYQLTYKVGSFKEDPLNFKICDSTNKYIMDCIEKCNEALLDRCKELVMDVSVDIFCAWSEFEENGKTMQLTIGELCYMLRSQLLNINSVAGHAVVDMIKQISRKPANVQDLINTADTNTIIEKINNNVTRALWVRAVINKDNLFQNVDLVHHLINNLQVLNNEGCHRLFNMCLNHLLGDRDDVHIQMLAMKAFQCCSTPTKQDILEQRFSQKSLFSIGPHSTPELINAITETFNKFIANDNVDFSEVLCMFLRSPSVVYIKIFELATQNSKQTDIMFKSILLLKSFSCHYFSNETEPCVIKTAQNMLEKCKGTEETRQNLTKFLCLLKNAEIIPKAKLLIMIIMPYLHKGLITRDILLINVQLKLLSTGFSIEDLVPEYRAPLLALLAKVLDVVRWKVNTFITLSPSTLELALELQNSLFQSFGAQIPHKEASWLRTNLGNTQPLNLYYFKGLWNPPGDNFVETISGKKVHIGMNTEQLSTWLSQVLCSTTQKEWCDIWESMACFNADKKLDIFHIALCFITLAEASNRSESTWECLMNCLRNFVYILRYKFFQEPLSDDSVISAVDKISSLANVLRDDNVEDVTAAFLPIFVYISGRKNDHTVNITNLLTSRLKNPKFHAIVSLVFASG